MNNIILFSKAMWDSTTRKKISMFDLIDLKNNY